MARLAVCLPASSPAALTGSGGCLTARPSRYNILKIVPTSFFCRKANPSETGGSPVTIPLSPREPHEIYSCHHRFVCLHLLCRRCLACPIAIADRRHLSPN